MILIAGIGNIFFGDDAFGCEVVRQLLRRYVRSDVRIVDFGIRGLDLAFALMDEFDAAILVDAMPHGQAPGTVSVVEPDLEALNSTPPALEAHALDPMRVLALARSLGAELKTIRIVGCEPDTFGPPDEGQIGLSPRVAHAVDKAIEVIQLLISEIEVKETFA